MAEGRPALPRGDPSSGPKAEERNVPCRAIGALSQKFSVEASRAAVESHEILRSGSFFLPTGNFMNYPQRPRNM